MDSRDNERAKYWLDTLGTKSSNPNLINEASGDYLERAWSAEFDDEHLVYYERESGDKAIEDKIEYWIGNLAINDTNGLSPEETREALLSSINTRVTGNEQARNSLAVLIGVRYNARNRIALPRRTQEHAEASHFYKELEKLTGLSVDESSILGLANFRTLPLGRNDHRWVYVYGHKELELNDKIGVPILGYHKTARVWRLRLVEPARFSGFFNTQPGTLLDFLDNGHDWHPVDVDDIKQLTTVMSEVKSSSL